MGNVATCTILCRPLTGKEMSSVCAEYRWNLTQSTAKDGVIKDASKDAGECREDIIKTGAECVITNMPMYEVYEYSINTKLKLL